MHYIEVSYLIYLAISISLTVWVARTLHSRGRVFLVNTFGGNAEMADSVNHLLVVGFYLINIGFVTLVLSSEKSLHDLRRTIEFLSTKIGIVLLVLGMMHFFNLLIFARIRQRSEWDR